MNMRKLTLIIFLTLSALANASDFTFRLKNTLGFTRSAETVEVDVPEGSDLRNSVLTSEYGDVVPFETIGSNTIRFRATVGRGTTIGYALTAGSHEEPAKATYAAVKLPSNRADIAWENDLCAYRMYSSVLLKSEPNTAQGVDVWFKKRATPVIDEMYNLSNYHNESLYGVDAYSVNGKRLGCGGTAVVENGHLVTHDPYNTCEITEEKALKSAFTLKYNNVKANGQTYTKTLNVETTAGALLNRATVRLDGPSATLRMAVAIYQHTDMTNLVEGVAFTDVPGLVGWAEAKSEGSITSAGARCFQGAYVPAEFNPSTEVIDNHLCLVDVTAKGLTGKAAAEALDETGIIVNKNTIPFDRNSPFVTSGIRIGTATVTTRGMKEPEMKFIADRIRLVLANVDDAAVKAKVRAEVADFVARFPVP